MKMLRSLSCISSPPAVPIIGHDSGRPLPPPGEPSRPLKLLLLGAQGVGKTALCDRLVASQSSNDTINSSLTDSISFEDSPCSKAADSDTSPPVPCAHPLVRIQVEDFSTTESTVSTKDNYLETVEEVDDEEVSMRIREVASEFPVSTELRQSVLWADGLVLVYSVTCEHSLNITHQLCGYIQEIRGDTGLPVVLVGNKKDMSTSRAVTHTQGCTLAFELGVAFYETSACMSRDDVTSAFHDLVRQIWCVRLRREQEEEEQDQGLGVGLCGVRGLVTRLSLRAQGGKRFRRKLSATF